MGQQMWHSIFKPKRRDPINVGLSFKNVFMKLVSVRTALHLEYELAKGLFFSFLAFSELVQREKEKMLL